VPDASEKLWAVPAHVIDADVTEVLDVPVLAIVTKLPAAAPHVKVEDVPPDVNEVAVSEEAVTATSAVLAEAPKIPKTNPAIATDATKVAALMRTVAMMGEIPTLARFTFYHAQMFPIEPAFPWSLSTLDIILLRSLS